MKDKKILIIGDEPAEEGVVQSILLYEVKCKVVIYYPSSDFENFIKYYNPI